MGSLGTSGRMILGNTSLASLVKKTGGSTFSNSRLQSFFLGPSTSSLSVVNTNTIGNAVRNAPAASPGHVPAELV